ncbi:MAG: outer membrane protein assembly factor BamD [Lentimicrobiaceae bacterium]|nr:outer membrane protein assembly factor BamD [Lentimicrobiaceae bacterium]
MRKITVLFILIALFSVGSEAAVSKKKPEKKSRISRKYKTKEAKYQAAKTYYAKGAYLSAAQLFEEVYPLYMSSREGDTILFLFADSYMKNADYLMAAFHFRDYIRRYPQSPRVEEASFLSARCYYLNSPVYNLDQTDSRSAIENLEFFINAYPQSPFVETANGMIDTLQTKLARKDFNVAVMYYNTGNYNAAQIYFSNLLKDYPGTVYTEEALYYMIKNSYEYAQKSVESKKVERYQMAIDNCLRLRALKADSKFLPEVAKLMADAIKKRDKLLENK